MVEIFQLLKDNHQSLSVAESCTGGGLAAKISEVAGISEVFFGSITAYANQAKEKILHIPSEIITSHGAVSEQVALLMAKNCRKLFLSSWAISTTGIAGPTGATPNKPVGLVWIGISGPQVASASKFIFEHATRLEHREKTVHEALLMLKKALLAQKKLRE